MSIVGSAPGIGTGLVGEIGALRAVGASDLAPAPQSVAQSVVGPASPAVAAEANAAVATGSALDAGAAPVDQDRVAAIKKAIENNSYPVVPTKIGDAMIAAGLLLRITK